MRRSCRLRNCFSPFSCFRRMVLRVSISEGQANCNRQSYSGSSIAIQISKPNPKRKCSVHCGAQRENNIQPGVIGLWLASISVVGIFSHRTCYFLVFLRKNCSRRRRAWGIVVLTGIWFPASTAHDGLFSTSVVFATSFFVSE